MQVPIYKITTPPDRQRQYLGDIQSLADSIQRHGQLQPIIIDRNFGLIAGERRLAAHKLLNRTEIDAVFIDQLSEIDRKIVELEENWRRKELTWPERCRAIHQISQLSQKSLRELETDLGRSKSSLSEDLDLACALNDMPELSAIQSAKTALKVYKTVMRSAMASQLSTNNHPPLSDNTDCTSTSWSLLQGNCLELIHTVANESINLILTDPPFGINIDQNTRHIGSYIDDAQSLIDTINCLSPELFRVAAPGCHIYMFCVEQNIKDLNIAITGSGFENFGQLSLVWNKTVPTSPGLHNQSTWWPLHELIIAAFKPPFRPLNSLGAVGSVLSYTPVLPAQKIHPCERPQALLCRLIELSSLLGDTVLDPFAGSGSTLLAANSLNRNSIGFELDRSHYSLALQRLKQS